jgi:hypothetical protein
MYSILTAVGYSWERYYFRTLPTIFSRPYSFLLFTFTFSFDNV